MSKGRDAFKGGASSASSFTRGGSDDCLDDGPIGYKSSLLFVEP